jgi:hypothetical protein
MKQNHIIIVLVTALLASLLMPVSDTQSASPKMFVPKSVFGGSYEVGSAVFRLVNPWLDAVSRTYGITTRIVPSATDVGRQILLRNNVVDITGGGTEAYLSSQGLFAFANYEWGPRPIQSAWFGLRMDGNGLIVAADSGIKKIADLKGKRVGWYPGQDLVNYALTPSVLAFAGLTWDDVKKVNVHSITGGVQAIMTGNVDAAYGSTIGGYARELEASSHGIHYMEMPGDDKEGWKRAREIYPLMAPVACTVGAGVSKEKPKWLESLLFVMMVNEDKPVETVYFMTRSFHETYNIYSKAQTGVFEGWDIDTSISLIELSIVPFHKGSVEYFKDIGKWNQKLESLNQSRIEQYRKVKAAYDKAKDEALEKQMSAEKFADYWTKRRAELFK